jgi:hypothetical protein
MTKTALLIIVAALCGCSAQTEVINYRTYTDPERGIFYIVDGQVLDHAALISGVGGDQQRVVLTREP